MFELLDHNHEVAATDAAAGSEVPYEMTQRLNTKLFGALAALETRHQLRIAHRGLTDADIQVIARTTRASIGKLAKLDLSSNYLTSACAGMLAELLASAPVLEELNLGGVPWGDRAIDALLKRSGTRHVVEASCCSC